MKLEKDKGEPIIEFPDSPEDVRKKFANFPWGEDATASGLNWWRVIVSRDVAASGTVEVWAEKVEIRQGALLAFARVSGHSANSLIFAATPGKWISAFPITEQNGDPLAVPDLGYSFERRNRTSDPQIRTLHCPECGWFNRPEDLAQDEFSDSREYKCERCDYILDAKKDLSWIPRYSAAGTTVSSPSEPGIRARQRTEALSRRGRCAKLSVTQKTVIWLSLAVFAAIGLYPPWVEVAQWHERRYAYGWLFNPPQQRVQTFEDLGRIVKQRYPVYNRYSDAEVGQGLKKKYPGLYDEYVEAPFPEAETQSHWRTELDTGRLLSEWLVLTVVAAGLVWMWPSLSRPRWLIGWRLRDAIRLIVVGLVCLVVLASIADQYGSWVWSQISKLW